MQDKVFYSSEYVCISKREDSLFIESFRRGMTLEQFLTIMQEQPNIRITSVMTVRNALVNAPRPPEKFAEYKERITVELSEDELKAYIILCVDEKELLPSGRAALFKEIVYRLKEYDITYGIKKEVLLSSLSNNTKILAAEGIASVNGVDSAIKTYELKETRPEAKEDGNVDHYELNLINRVAAGDWLGEKTDPTDGFPGKTVKGSMLMPSKGKDLPLFYDKNTAREVYQDGKTTIYARINGAVHYDGGRIGVSNHFEIDGNVGFKTGNIDFDGFITIKGTIEDGFSVSATKDIEILGDYGVGTVKEINSSGGSIYIKGGIAGKNRAVIRSKRNIFTKFVSDTAIICDGSVHIGFYCLNSKIRAKEVILDSAKGQIIGGNIDADIRVVASTIGSVSEVRTCISVAGFDRMFLKSSLDRIETDIEKMKARLAKAKQEVSVYGNVKDLTREQVLVYEKIRDEYFAIRDGLKNLEEERKTLTGYLRAHGEGEISILKKVYPNTKLEIKKIAKEITAPATSVCFYVQDGEIKEL
ncbi:MAG: FapA family protein [Clostridiaceae bacterium]